MTEQEIEELREKLGGDYSVKRQNGAITVELVDIWKGVEFAQNYMSKVIYPIGQIEYFDRNDQKYWRPSTESDYVEQLKAKAHELYGEIKDGDRFDRSDMEFGIPQAIGRMSSIELGWDYSNEDDQLYLGDLCLYNKGKWAKKIERVKVVPSEIHYPKPHLDQYVTVELRVIGGILDASKSNRAAKELAKCLEDYLNKS